MRTFILGVFLLAFLAAVVAGAAAADLPDLLPNPSFELGDVAPDGWSPFASATYGPNAEQGGRCVTTTGTGDDMSYWQAGPIALIPGQLYRVSYQVRRAPGASDGTTIAGLSSCNHDLTAGAQWQQEQFFFRARTDLKEDTFRVGQWHVNGAVQFDDVSMQPAIAVHYRPAGLGLPLGDGEAIAAGRYTATHRLGGLGSDDCWFLERFTAGFNTDRWLFSSGSEVVYLHQLGRLKQDEGEVEVSINYYVHGVLLIEASADGSAWLPVGQIDKVSRATFPIPSELLPTRDLWVRLRSEGQCELQVDAYQYRCRLPDAPQLPSLTGETHYLAITRTSPDLEVAVDDISALTGRADLTLVSRGARRQVGVTITVQDSAGHAAAAQERLLLTPNAQRQVTVPVRIPSPGRQTMRITCADPAAPDWGWQAEGGFTVSPLNDSRGGELLLDDPDLTIWWCEPERKVSRTRPAPTTNGAALRISAAGNEYEPAQLVLRPKQRLRDCQVTVSDLAGPDGARLPSSQLEIRQVVYVTVQQPTDELGEPGLWPDPLPPHAKPVPLPAELNHPFWITLHVPAGTPAGDYRGDITIQAQGLTHTVPIEVHVWGFALPEETHVRSGFGMGEWNLRRYHNLETEEEIKQVFDLYLQSFAAHRISPYTFGRNIEVKWTKTPDGQVEPQLDFSGFDEDAHHAFDDLHFNSFVLELTGMGGGTYHDRHLGELAGYQQGTPEYEAAFRKYVGAVQDHLEQRGWLDKAYVYWFDEPDRKDYDFVRDGMQLLHRAGPRLTRLLTTHPTPELYGDVDLWCLPTFTLDPDVTTKRKAAGEELWWYLCTGPKAPYFTLFIDHYGTELRLWLWETWKYHLDGILVWATDYWTSSAAYPGDALQNPWEDTMSWTSGYSTPEGQRLPWGNGDGRFFYPPNRNPGVDKTKYLEGPVPSIRWELLRDGIEDYEYFHLLQSHIERLKQSGADPATYREAERLLEVPADICTDTQHFTTTPEPIHEHRRKLAEAIEGLARQ